MAAERWLNKTLQLTKLLTIKKTRAMKTKRKKLTKANVMMATAVIAGVYFVVWALIGMVL
jgi:methionine-rich copper-binding protein CopC